MTTGNNSASRRINIVGNKIDRTYPDVLLTEGSISQTHWIDFCNRIDEILNLNLSQKGCTRAGQGVFSGVFLVFILIAVSVSLKMVVFNNSSYSITTILVIVVPAIVVVSILGSVIFRRRASNQLQTEAEQLKKVCDDMTRQYRNVRFQYGFVTGDDENPPIRYIDIVTVHVDTNTVTPIQIPSSSAMSSNGYSNAVVSNTNNNEAKQSNSIFSSLESELVSSTKPTRFDSYRTTPKKSILERLSELDAIKPTLTPKEYREMRDRILADK